MNEQLENLPETVYVEDANGILEPGEYIAVDGIGYDANFVRIDIVKEREAKLIRAAYHSCISLSDAECLEKATALLYKKSKLEELK